LLLNALGKRRIQHDPDEYALRVFAIITEHCENKMGVVYPGMQMFRDHMTTWRSRVEGIRACSCETVHLNVVESDEGVVELATNNGQALPALFRSFVLDQYLSSVECEACNAHLPPGSAVSAKIKRRVRKTWSILRPGFLIIISLKRFKCVKKLWVKDSAHVSFPFDLDIGEFVSNMTSDEGDRFTQAGGTMLSGVPVLRFALRAITVHMGTSVSGSGGHHIAFAQRPSPTGASWFQFNDSSVTPVDSATVMAAEAQLLLYEALDPRVIAHFRSPVVPLAVPIGPASVAGPLPTVAFPA
jgi:hypothetical protein